MASSSVGEEAFAKAQADVIQMKSELPMKVRLRLYSYFKQATNGNAPDSISPWSSVVDRTKHASWMRRWGMERAEARARYVAIAADLAAAREASTADSSGGLEGVPLPSRQRSAGGNAPRRGETAGAEAQAEAATLRARVAELEEELAALGRHQPFRGWLWLYSPDAAGWIGGAGGLKWERRFFVLMHDQLLYFRAEGELKPRRVLKLANCVVVDEGIKRTKLRGAFHIVSLYTAGTLESERGPGSGALMRFSCASEEEAAMWIEKLQAATDEPLRRLAETETPPPPPRRTLSNSVGLDGQPLAPRAGTLRAQPPPPPISVAAADAAGAAAAPRPMAETPTKKHRKPLDPNLFPASRPMHRAAKASLLSSRAADDDGASPTNLSGFMNLVILLFVVTNARLVLENLLRHGVQIYPFLLPADAGAASAPALSLGLLARRVAGTASALSVPTLAAFLIERSAVLSAPAGAYRRHVANHLHGINAFACLAMPCALVYHGDNFGGAGGGVLLLIVSVTLFLKLVSWAHVHHDLRLAERESSALDDHDLDGRLAKFSADVQDVDVRVHYPKNVTLPNLLYFIAAPTLCYQTHYPRTPRVRKVYLLSLSLRLVALATLLPLGVIQYLLPLLRGASDAIVARDGPLASEAFLRLSLPITYAWVLGFYTFFHVWLNLLAEVLRFGDRVFYRDWWNAHDLETYWRTWNMPVHLWIVRHAYFPLLRHLTKGKTATGFLCFTLSAVLHELVVAFPLRSFYMPLAVVGMMLQVPMLPISAMLKRQTKGTAFEQAGNYLFWMTFCFIGQPACVLLYYMHAVGAWGGAGAPEA